MAQDVLKSRIAETLAGVREARRLKAYILQRVVSSSSEAVLTHEGRQYVNLISNNYLGLSTHPRVMEAAAEALRKYGTGMCGSPLACGTTELHARLENRIASVFGMESAMVFAAGYQALLGTIQGFVGQGDLVLVDALSHRSIIDGVKLSGAGLRAFIHNDVGDLEEQLGRLRKKHGLALIAVDSVYSMEGDLAPLAGLSRAARANDACLLLDEAHSLGMIGPRGYGLMDNFGLPGSADLVSGTFSKFAGACGGYTAASAEIIDYLKHRSSPFIFSASAPPATIAGVLAAFDVLDREPERRKTLADNTAFFRRSLREAGLSIGGETHVVPLRIGDVMQAMKVTRAIFEAGILASPIMPPTVPVKDSGIRFGIMATHGKKHLEKAVEVVIRACKAAGA